MQKKENHSSEFSRREALTLVGITLITGSEFSLLGRLFHTPHVRREKQITPLTLTFQELLDNLEQYQGRYVRIERITMELMEQNREALHAALYKVPDSKGKLGIDVINSDEPITLKTVSESLIEGVGPVERTIIGILNKTPDNVKYIGEYCIQTLPNLITLPN